MIPQALSYVKPFCILFFFFYSFHLNAQEYNLQPDSSQAKEKSIEHIATGYNLLKKNEATSPFARRSEKHFNKGLISDPLLLIQGQIPGVQVYNRGGNPNTPSLIRIRGLSGFSQTAPLYIIDGVPGASIQNLDPNDIASISVLKDGASQASYGIRASNGVVLIATKDAQDANKPIHISYEGQAAYSDPYSSIAVMNAEEFRAAGGVDLGSSTNWMEEITRNGFSNTHSLAISGKRKNISYRLSGNYRNVEGILNKSGFEQINSRANIKGAFLKDKLKINLTASYTDRTSQLGFNEAFRYAISMNPTAPIFAEGAPYTFNREQFGGFFELAGLFDSFNPRALVEQNDRDGKRQEFTSAALVTYQLNPNLKLNFRYAYQDQFSNERAFFSPQSYFLGGAFPPASLKGIAVLDDVEDDLSLYEAFVNYNLTAGKGKWEFVLGSFYQAGDHRDQHLVLRGFTDKALIDETRRIEDVQNWSDLAVLTENSINGWSNDLSAFFGHANYNYQDKIFLNASFRYEGSSTLGEDNRWGLFPSLGAAFDLQKIMNISSLDQLHVRMGYGITGNIPRAGGLSRNYIVLVQQEDDSFLPDTTRVANPNLTWERKAEINLGLDFKFGNLSGYIDWYNRQVSDGITQESTRFNAQRYVNRYGLNSSGIELGLNIALIRNNALGYETGLFFFANQVEFRTAEPEPTSATSVGGFIQNPVIEVQKGSELGNIWTLEFGGVDIDGTPILVDVNEDGFINTDVTQALAPQSDFNLVGNGLPDYELGWSQHFEYKSWRFDALFRGVFGHSLVNRNRQFHELRPTNIRPIQNIVNTSLAEEELQFTRITSLYVEKADYIKLDFVSISKTFSLGSKGQELGISLTGQNLLTISSYTGADPEPVFEDTGATSGGSGQFNIGDPNPLAPGIDRRSNYLPARTIVLGLNLKL